MDRKDQVDGLITGFGKLIGIPELALDEENGCTLGFDDQVISFRFHDEKDVLVLFSELGKVPKDNAEPLYRELLEANFNRDELDGSALSCCRASDSIVLIGQKSLQGLDVRALDRMVENFTNIAVSWAARINRPWQGEEKSSNTDEGIQNNWISI